MRLPHLVSTNTAERPQLFVADAAARYLFALKYCRHRQVLDVGTGLGQGAHFLALNGATSVLGIDYSLPSIHQARKNAPLNAKFKTLTADKLKILNQKFDVILAFEIIEHLPPPQAILFIASIRSLLHPDGFLLLTTPNGLESDLIFGRIYNPYHQKEYTPTELKIILKPHFRNVNFYGLKCINPTYLHDSAAIKTGLIYRLAFFLGHFKLIREFLSLIPQNLKYAVTHENILSPLSATDYRLNKNLKGCPNQFVICRT